MVSHPRKSIGGVEVRNSGIDSAESASGRVNHEVSVAEILDGKRLWQVSQVNASWRFSLVPYEDLAPQGGLQEVYQ